MLASYSSYYAHTWPWRRMRRYGGLSRGVERSSPRQFFRDCTIAMCGYDFREGQVTKWRSSPCRVIRLRSAFLENENPAEAGGDCLKARPRLALADRLRTCSG